MLHVYILKYNGFFLNMSIKQLPHKIITQKAEIDLEFFGK